MIKDKTKRYITGARWAIGFPAGYHRDKLNAVATRV